ncbi:vitamin K epoxide reductase [Sulfodiicoccus acidiphilus]|uniref:Vitamin K epoxide reductase n=1 Tax=Sulfodiicoccus acidiphilus TaxID=1670455 RepID=A0A348B4D2_9CREN|nr:vitamin K epoxide reductase family protein [Sulfodiicoccus acidiphilus]BBD73034.1 vitamin K epoxide reductase [Sulfodiicoccus acidiphilus]GGU05633.1 vitamin K epoxide reductase [Sulfodiicoccus acidiphilus]
MEKKGSKLAGPLSNALLTVGAADSAYLLVLTEVGKPPSLCGVSGPVDCAKVEFSPFSHFFGVPVALLGLVWFLLVAFLWNWNKGRWTVPYLWVLATVFVGYLVYTELLIRSVCIYCSLAQAMGVLMILPILLKEHDGS